MATIMKLDGTWEFSFDAVDAGLIDQWYRKKPASVKKVTLPHVWNLESNEENAHIAYYFREFQVDKKESPKRFFIRFGSVQHHAQVWLNGEDLGTHLGGHVPFEVDGSKSVKIGENNNLVVRVQTLDRQGKIGEYAGRSWPWAALPPRTIRRHHRGREPVHGRQSRHPFPQLLSRFRGRSRHHRSQILESQELPGRSGLRDHQSRRRYRHRAESVKLEKENGSFSLTLQMDGGRSGICTIPCCTRSRCRWQVPTMPRSASACAAPTWKRVPSSSTTIRSRSREWPTLVLRVPARNPPPDFDLRKELTTLKESGFNLLRSGGAPLPREALDICDEIGMLVLQETTCYHQKSSKEGLENLKVQIQTLIDQDGWHPSIFGWVIGSDNGSMVLENGNKLLRYAAELDPTRPIFSNLSSVIIDSLGGGKIDLGKVYEPIAAAINPFESHKLKIGFPVSLKTYSMLANYCSSKDGKAVADGIHGSKSYWERYNYLKDDLDGKVLVDGLGVSSPESLQEELDASKKFSSHPEYKDVQKLNQELAQLLKKRTCSDCSRIRKPFGRKHPRWRARAFPSRSKPCSSIPRSPASSWTPSPITASTCTAWSIGSASPRPPSTWCARSTAPSMSSPRRRIARPISALRPP
jgi:hypothetical protein